MIAPASSSVDDGRGEPTPHAEAFRVIMGYHLEQHVQSEAVESLSQQLSESYEELNLLYAMSQNMTVVQHPNRFVATACEGLLQTLPYRWIAVQFAEDRQHLHGLSGRLVLAGDVGQPLHVVRRLTSELLSSMQPDAPRVFDEQSPKEDRKFLQLGTPTIAHPICRDQILIGVVLACGKYGSDRTASSVDTKLLAAAASHTGIFLENAVLYEDMDAMFVGTLEALTAAIDAKDRYTSGHSLRVAHLSQLLAHSMGLPDDIVKRVHVAGLVHDVGKIGVPEAVLCKTGRLSESEFSRVKQHPEIGHRILKDIPQLEDILPGVLHHHERWDGAGYPHGIAGMDIPQVARIIALADSFDAMSSTRTYRSARSRTWVLEEIERCAGTQFDPELAKRFITLDFTDYDRYASEHRAREAGGAAA